MKLGKSRVTLVSEVFSPKDPTESSYIIIWKGVEPSNHNNRGQGFPRASGLSSTITALETEQCRQITSSRPTWEK